MNAGAILRSKTVAIVSTGILGAGLLGGVAFAAIPSPTDGFANAAPVTGTDLGAADDKAKAKLKAALDALVAKNVITPAQEDAIIAALAAAHQDKDHPKLREFVGAVLKESVDYIGLPAQAVKEQVMAGKSLGQIADQRPGKSRDGLVSDLEAKAADRIKDAVAAGTLTQAQADALTPKVDAAIVKIVDHQGSRKPNATTPAKPTN
ncbi:MAG TPA: hypothetical protein VKR80_05895 [Candidatus Limnocylindria bacterium]|nr:hypothetical protein [Candidatus Limnocylindria bacterium]